ncbi:MAG: 2Fe-2S iron-sulfur cluster-binding protein, partial [Rhodospirillaceae bacterium]|nr:2Fe-2S iron-sulfur cluster-binding protein [Rhodospirillaceae bacterium]
MTGSFRIDCGLDADSKPVRFRFNGKEFSGRIGDTLASALLANGQRLVGRSFKYHRPRGIFSAGSEEPNALVELRSGAFREPNTKATVIEIFDGLEASSQNHRGSLEFDLLAVNDLLSPFLTAGFYYKTFMWPKSFWERLYEPLIRSAAGLGSLSMQPDPDSYDKGFIHCDVLVVGAGPTGLSGGRAGRRGGGATQVGGVEISVGGRR